MTDTATDHVKNQLCQRIEELESEKMELNEQLDALQEERDSYQREFALATEVLGEIHEALNGSGPAIVGMEAVQVRQLQGERDALAAHVERLHMAWVDAKRCVAVVAFPSLHHAESYQDLAKWSIKKLEAVVSETPETSLARQKARWQRDLVTQLAEGFRQAWSEHPGKHAWILGAGDAICRQAEGGGV